MFHQAPSLSPVSLSSRHNSAQDLVKTNSGGETPSPREIDSPASNGNAALTISSNGNAGGESSALPVAARTATTTPEHPKTPEPPPQSPHHLHLFHPYQQRPIARYAIKNEQSHEGHDVSARTQSGQFRDLNARSWQRFKQNRLIN